jgi:hypothetical protein
MYAAIMSLKFRVPLVVNLLGSEFWKRLKVGYDGIQRGIK